MGDCQNTFDGIKPQSLTLTIIDICLAHAPMSFHKEGQTANMQHVVKDDRRPSWSPSRQPADLEASRQHPTRMRPPHFDCKTPHSV